MAHQPEEEVRQLRQLEDPFHLVNDGYSCCCVCNGRHQFGANVSIEQKSHLHCIQCSGCPWVQANITDLCDILLRAGISTARQYMNSYPTAQYSGSVAGLISGAGIKVWEQRDIKFEGCRPLIDAGTLVAPKHPDLSVCGNRRDTFMLDIFPTMNMPISGCQLAEGGWFYEGIRDQVKCFWCAGHMENFRASHISSQSLDVTHARYYPGCPLPALLNGADFCKKAFQSADLNLRATARNVYSSNMGQYAFQTELMSYVDSQVMIDNAELEIDQNLAVNPLITLI